MQRDGCSFSVEVGNRMLAEALVAAARRLGWEVALPPLDADVLVTDRVTARPTTARPGGRTILVSEPTAADARRALDAVAELLVAAVVLSDDPDDLAAALTAIVEDRVSIPGRVLQLAGQMPVLSERQSAVLVGLVGGETNGEISRRLYLSLATVKREIAVLYDALAAATRPALIARARDLGVRPLGSKSEPASAFL